jgi:hypothetical protein
MLVLLWQYPEPSRLLFLLSWVFPSYYVGLSIALNMGRNAQKYART